VNEQSQEGWYTLHEADHEDRIVMADAEHSPVSVTESSVEDLRDICRDQPGTLYAILDACDEPRVPEKVKELGPERAVSLYRGWAERDYWAIAPYLVQVDEQLLDWIVQNLWQDPWGLFAVAATDIVALRKHFRRFLMVEDEDGERLYFRFYDPRVLNDFLATVSQGEAEQFFGPIDALFTAVEPVGTLLMYAHQTAADSGSSSAEAKGAR
jgi:hypothetical protein